MQLNTITGLFASAVFALQLNLVSPMAFAEEHLPGSIEGTGIHLFERDHTFSGSILDRPVFGEFHHDDFTADVRLHVAGDTVVLSMVDHDGIYSGTVKETRTDKSGNTTDVTTSVELIGVKKTGDLSGMITIKIDSKEIPVTITGKSFENKHFQEPDFAAEIDGKNIQFHFTGQGCFGYSSNLSMMILAAYVHLSK